MIRNGNVKSQDVFCVILKGVQYLKIKIVRDEKAGPSLVPGRIKKKTVPVTVTGKKDPF